MTTTDLDADLSELIAMADMFASTCTRQEEKYQSMLQRGYTWRWEDCKAAYELIRERADWYALMEAWRAQHKCRACGFPKEHHAFSCRAARPA